MLGRLREVKIKRSQVDTGGCDLRGVMLLLNVQAGPVCRVSSMPLPSITYSIAWPGTKDSVILPEYRLVCKTGRYH